MLIFVKANPSAGEEKIEELTLEEIPPIAGFKVEKGFKVSVKEPPVQGRANRAILGALSKYFVIPQFKIKIVFGYTSRQKIIEIN